MRNWKKKQVNLYLQHLHSLWGIEWAAEIQETILEAMIKQHKQGMDRVAGTEEKVETHCGIGVGSATKEKRNKLLLDLIRELLLPFTELEKDN